VSSDGISISFITDFNCEMPIIEGEDEKEIKLSIWAVSAPATMQMEGFSRQSLSKGLPKLRRGFLSAKVCLRPCPSVVSV
jgi:hypothetical protein